MAEIVESDTAQVIFLQNFLKSIRDVSGTNHIPGIIGK